MPGADQNIRQDVERPFPVPKPTDGSKNILQELWPFPTNDLTGAQNGLPSIVQPGCADSATKYLPACSIHNSCPKDGDGNTKDKQIQNDLGNALGALKDIEKDLVANPVLQLLLGKHKHNGHHRHPTAADSPPVPLI